MKIASLYSLVSFAFLSVSVAGAGVAVADDAGAPKGVTSEGPAAAGKKVDWEHLSLAEKKKYMKATVLPEMKKAFQAYDAKSFQKFNCATCHGDGATDGKFKMPNPKLPKLPSPTDRAGFIALQQKKPDAAKFMGTVVKPKMAELLGVPEWTPKTPAGFGCYQCHTKD